MANLTLGTPYFIETDSNYVGSKDACLELEWKNGSFNAGIWVVLHDYHDDFYSSQFHPLLSTMGCTSSNCELNYTGIFMALLCSWKISVFHPVVIFSVFLIPALHQKTVIVCSLLSTVLLTWFVSKGCLQNRVALSLVIIT